MTRYPSTSALLGTLTRHQDLTLIQELWEHFPEHMFLIRVESPQRFVIEAVKERCGCTIGLGIADFTPHDDFTSLVEKADRGLLRAKRSRQSQC